VRWDDSAPGRTSWDNCGCVGDNTELVAALHLVHDFAMCAKSAHLRVFADQTIEAFSDRRNFSRLEVTRIGSFRHNRTFFDGCECQIRPNDDKRVNVVSCVTNAKDIKTKDYDAKEIIESIRKDKHFKLRELIEDIRNTFQKILANAPNDRKAAKEAVAEKKRRLPAALWSGTFSQRKKDALLQHSGLLCADLDQLGDQLTEARTKLLKSLHLWALFLSPTGDGLKCIFRVQAEADTQKASFRAVEEHVRALTGVQIDESCSDVARLCFLSHDPDAYLNDKAIELPPLAEVDKSTTTSGACAGAPEIETRRRIAIELLGEIDWATETSGYCTCPGQRLHTTGDGERDCEVYLDGAPTVTCFHSHCRDIREVKNYELRSRIGKAERAVGIPKDDLARAKRLVDELDGEARYVSEWGKWLLWDGRHWLIDSSGAGIAQRAFQLLEKFEEMAETVQGKTARQAAFACVRAAKSKRAIDAMIGLAKSFPEIAANISDFDANAWLFGVQNGVIDLKTGTFRTAHAGDHILKKSKAIYDPNAKCPMFDAFLEQVLPGSGLISFFWRAVGYSMTGLTIEQVLFFLHGIGANGKSTVIEMLEKLFGDYGWRAPATLFLEDKWNSSQSNLIASLPERRFVVGAEVPTNARLAESRIKDLTGGDSLNGRKLYCEAFNFRPTHKLWFYGNHKPTIRGTDAGIWRRIRLIPFTVQIPEEQRDTGIVERLSKELPGILNRAIQGCLDWQKYRLGTPQCVTQATEDYREEEDSIGEFINEQCVVAPGMRLRKADLFQAYTQWCEARGVRFTFGPKPVVERVRQVPNIKEDRTNKEGRVWIGLSLKDRAAFDLHESTGKSRI
jgi:P4 family phage/plasmid primase-like protien